MRREGRRGTLEKTEKREVLTLAIFFWHEYEQNGYLSNWYERPFEIDGFRYLHVEQYIMAQKAKLFGDTERYTQILRATSPRECKALGKLVTPYEDEVWAYFRAEVLKKGLLAKFSQNGDLLQQLLSTEDELLAEASPKDKIFGIGMDAATAAKFSPNAWSGQNLLGKTLMDLRRMLRVCPRAYPYR